MHTENLHIMRSIHTACCRNSKSSMIVWHFEHSHFHIAVDCQPVTFPGLPCFLAVPCRALPLCFDLGLFLFHDCLLAALTFACSVDNFLDYLGLLCLLILTRPV